MDYEGLTKASFKSRASELRPSLRKQAIRDGNLDVFDPVLSAFKNMHLKAKPPMLVRLEEGLDAKKLASSIKSLELQTPIQAPLPPPTKTTAEAVKEQPGILFTDQWHLVTHEPHYLYVYGTWEL